MWIIFDSITQHHDLPSRSGGVYSGWVLRGTRKGFAKALDPKQREDKEYEKVIFDNDAAIVIEKGHIRPNCSVAQFFQKGVKPGDTVEVRFNRSGMFPKIETLENITGKTPTYEPLPDDTPYAKSVEPADYDAGPSEVSIGSDVPPYMNGVA